MPACEKTCCFTGHRRIPAGQIPDIQKRLEKTILRLLSQGVSYFGCDGALGFDTLYALTLL